MDLNRRARLNNDFMANYNSSIPKTPASCLATARNGAMPSKPSASRPTKPLPETDDTFNTGPPPMPENGCAADAGHFTWSLICPGCPEPLAGIYYPSHVVFSDHSYDHINFCEECLMAIEYDDPEDQVGRIVFRYTTPANAPAIA